METGEIKPISFSEILAQPQIGRCVKCGYKGQVDKKGGCPECGEQPKKKDDVVKHQGESNGTV